VLAAVLGGGEVPSSVGWDATKQRFDALLAEAPGKPDSDTSLRGVKLRALGVT
jgi:hypothetical protein